jgi:release factor glutamine methyltransferase
LETEGKVAVEIGHTQRNEVTDIFAATGYVSGGVFGDLGGNDRVLIFKRG